MCCNSLVNFNYDKNLAQDAVKPDAVGRIGAFLTKPLVIACGREVFVTSSASDLTFQSAEKRAIITRIFFAFVAIAILPLTLIGLALTACSKSHSHYLNQETTVKPIKKPAAETENKATTTTTTATSTAKTKAVADTAKVSKQETGPVNLTKIATPIISENDLTDSQAGWENGVTDTDHTKAVNKLINKWSRSVIEEQTDKEIQKSISQFNTMLFAEFKKDAKKGKEVEIPRDFLGALRFRVMQDPMPISDKAETLEEGFYYIISKEDKLVKETDPEVLKNEAAFRYQNGNIEMFKAESRRAYLNVNGKSLPFKEGKGIDQPYYIFKEGDIVTGGNKFVRHDNVSFQVDIEYFFTVGPNGTILHGRPSFEPSKEAQQQTLNFNSGETVKFTTLKDAVEVENKLLQGFAFPSSEDPLIVIDIDHDPIFKKLVDYFKYELKNAPEDLKIFRLAMFAADLEKMGDNYEPIDDEQTYYLGDIVDSGKLDKKYNGLLVKALADQLDIPCTLVVQEVQKGSDKPTYKTWNVIYVGNQPHVLDSGKMVLLPIRTPPPMSYSLQSEYGTTELAEKKQH